MIPEVMPEDPCGVPGQAEVQHQHVGQEGAVDTPTPPPTPHEFAPQTPHWDGSHPIPTPAAGQGWAVLGHSLGSRTRTRECHPWVLPAGFQPWEQPSRLWDTEHPLALTQGGMVWRTQLALLQACLPQDFGAALGSSNPTPIRDGPEGNWFQFATHPRLQILFQGGCWPEQIRRSWEGGISHGITQAQQSPTFSCSATSTAGQRAWGLPNSRVPRDSLQPSVPLPKGLVCLRGAFHKQHINFLKYDFSR